VPERATLAHDRCGAGEPLVLIPGRLRQRGERGGRETPAVEDVARPPSAVTGGGRETAHIFRFLDHPPPQVAFSAVMPEQAELHARGPFSVKAAAEFGFGPNEGRPPTR
jgi:hypothetical protein